MSTLVIQPDNSNGQDGWIWQGGPTSSGGADQILQCAATDLVRSLIKIPLTSLPSNATVTDVVLTLKTNATTPSGSPTVRAYRVASGNSNWTEGLTWNTKNGSNSWAGSAGCSTAGTDFINTIMGSISPTVANTAYNMSIDLTQFENMRAANYGMLLKLSNEGSARNVEFRSCEYTTAADRPKLTITYTTPGGGNPIFFRGGFTLGSVAMGLLTNLQHFLKNAKSEFDRQKLIHDYNMIKNQIAMPSLAI